MSDGAKKRSPVLAAALVLGASGCILLVDPPSYGTTCTFSGSKSSCGTCIADQCTEELDGCCLDGACGDVLAEVESCATKHDSSCSKLQSPTDSGGAHRDLSSCIASRCKDACATSRTDCSPAYVTSINACKCFDDSTPNTTPCTSVGHQTLLCCAPATWPAPALECDCNAIICVSIAGGCMCELGPVDNDHPAAECRGGPGLHCCEDQAGTSCTCSSQPCLSTDTPVSDCTLAQLRCGPGLHEVRACSLLTP